MRRHAIDLIVVLTAATVAAAYLFATDPSWRSIIFRAYVLMLGAFAMLFLISAVGNAIPKRRRSHFELALARSQSAPAKVSDLERVQREVTLAISSAHDLHTRLAPHLREIAQARLERTGRTLSPHTAGRWWDLLRPDREPPADKFARGIPLAELRECLDDLERIG